MPNTLAIPQNNPTQFEIIDAAELAQRLRLPLSWIREQTRSRATDQIPHLRFGKYVRFAWQSPELNAWVKHRIRA